MASNTTVTLVDYDDYYKLGTDSNTAVVYILSVEAFIGLIGNIISIIVWTFGRQSSTLACSFYFRMLSCSDTFAMFYVVLLILRLLDVMVMNDFTCAIIGFLTVFTPSLSAWIIACISIERALSITIPLKFRASDLKKRAKILLLVSISVVVGANVHGFYMVAPKPPMGSVFLARTCILSENIDEHLFVILEDMSGTYVQCVIPFTLITFANVIVLIKLCLRKRFGNSSEQRRSVKLFTKLCIVSSVLQGISMIPVTVYHVHFDIASSEIDYHYTELVWFVISISTMYLNNSFNVFMYCFCTKNFLVDLKELCRCQRRDNGTPPPPIQLA